MSFEVNILDYIQITLAVACMEFRDSYDTIPSNMMTIVLCMYYAVIAV